MKHQANFQTPARVTGCEYFLALMDEIKSDDAAHDDGDKIPVRVLSLIERAFRRANAGEFK